MHREKWKMTQLSFFGPTEQEIKEQQKLIEVLIQLKSAEIQDDLYKNFFGTSEQIAEQKEIANEKINNFKARVQNAFPELIIN